MSDGQISERKLAIMQLVQGKKQLEVARNLNRSPRWVAKWYRRYREQGWAGLVTQSRAPKGNERQLSAEMRQLIGQTRLELEAEAALGTGLKYIGGQAVRTRLKQQGVTPLPSVPTIERVLRAGHFTQPRKKGRKPSVTFPHLQPTAPHQLHQVDIVPHYLQGGARIPCFNAIDVVSRYPCSWAFDQRRAQDAVTFLRHMWSEMGVAQYTQVDNEGCFSGGTTHPYVLGQVVRLALTVGTELVFSPFYHPQSNAYIERFHRDYNQHVWEDTYLEALTMVNQRGRHFVTLYRQREDHSQLAGQSPAVCHCQSAPCLLAATEILPPGKLPLREGRVHFMRQVTADGQVRVLNVDWAVPHVSPDRGVWVTLELRLTGALLLIYDEAPDIPARNCLAAYDFPLHEPVLPRAFLLSAPVTASAVGPASPPEGPLAQPQVSSLDPVQATHEAEVASWSHSKLLAGNLIRRSGRRLWTALHHADHPT